jgi:hypothetical protein
MGFKFAVLVRGDVDGGHGQTAPAAVVESLRGKSWQGCLWRSAISNLTMEVPLRVAGASASHFELSRTRSLRLR